MEFEDIMAFSRQNKNVYEEVLTLCRDKKIVPYVGAGLSVFAGVPIWEGFIKPLHAKYCKEEKYNDCLDAASSIEKRMGKADFYEEIFSSMLGNADEAQWKEILHKAETTNQASWMIPQLFSGPVITTNFDRVLERLFGYQHGNDLDFVAFPNDSEKIEQAKQKRKKAFVQNTRLCI